MSDKKDATKSHKKDVAKKVGVVVVAKKVLGKITKLAVVAGIGAAVVKVLRGEQR